MKRTIRIISGDVTVTAELNASPTADAVWEALPLHASASTWGDEIYFSISVKAGLEADARDVVEIGDLGYWPSGTAFCIFFGPTPVSRAGEIRPASAVNVFGKVVEDTGPLRRIADGSEIAVLKAL